MSKNIMILTLIVISFFSMPAFCQEKMADQILFFIGVSKEAGTQNHSCLKFFTRMEFYKKESKIIRTDSYLGKETITKYEFFKDKITVSKTSEEEIANYRFSNIISTPFIKLFSEKTKLIGLGKSNLWEYPSIEINCEKGICIAKVNRKHSALRQNSFKTTIDEMSLVDSQSFYFEKLKYSNVFYYHTIQQQIDSSNKIVNVTNKISKTVVDSKNGIIFRTRYNLDSGEMVSFNYRQTKDKKIFLREFENNKKAFLVFGTDKFEWNLFQTYNTEERVYDNIKNLIDITRTLSKKNSALSLSVSNNNNKIIRYRAFSYRIDECDFLKKIKSNKILQSNASN